MELTEVAHGVLGYTKTLQYDEETGDPIMSASDSNGRGILEGSEADYRVSDLFAADFRLSRIGPSSSSSG